MLGLGKVATERLASMSNVITNLTRRGKGCSLSLHGKVQHHLPLGFQVEGITRLGKHLHLDYGLPVGFPCGEAGGY